MPLTDIQIRNAKPKAAIFKLFDEKGLFLQVTPKGGKLWRFKYYHANKESLLALGSYAAQMIEIIGPMCGRTLCALAKLQLG